MANSSLQTIQSIDSNASPAQLTERISAAITNMATFLEQFKEGSDPQQKLDLRAFAQELRNLDVKNTEPRISEDTQIIHLNPPQTNGREARLFITTCESKSKGAREIIALFLRMNDYNPGGIDKTYRMDNKQGEWRVVLAEFDRAEERGDSPNPSFLRTWKKLQPAE